MSFPAHLNFLEPLTKDGIERDGEEFLLGNLDLDEEQYKSLLNYASALINKEKLLYKIETDMIISVALVFFAINDFKGNQFWDEFSKKVNAEELYVQKVCKKAFENFCKANNLYFHLGQINKGYVTSILTHAIIPKASVDKFLEFLEDIYFQELEESYIEEEVLKLVEYMHRLFSRYIEEEDIKIDVQGSKMTIARQQLPKAFRIAFVHSAGIVAPIIEKYLFYINELNYNHEITYEYSPRFDEYFRNYEKIRSQIQTKNTHHHSSRKEYIKRFSIAQYQLEEDSIYLHIPKQIIESEHVKDTIFLNVYSDESLIERKELSLIKSRLLFKTEAEKIKLSRMHNNIRYEIKTYSDLIYDSKDKLNKEYMIFNLDGEEVSPSQLREKTYRIITDKTGPVSIENGDIDSRIEHNYIIHTVFINSTSILRVNNWTITPNNRAVITEISQETKYKNMHGETKDKLPYSIYSQIPHIRLVITAEKKWEDYVLRLNGDNYLLKDWCSVSFSKITDGSGSTLASIKLKETLLQNSKPYSMMIREKGNLKPLVGENILIIPKLTYTFDKSFYYKEDVAQLSNFEIDNITQYKEKFPLKINLNNHSSVEVNFKNNSNEEITIKITIPKMEWELSEYHSSHHVNDIWYKKINNHVFKITFPDSISQVSLIDKDHYYIIEGRNQGTQSLFDLKDYLLVERKSPLTIGVTINGEQVVLTTIHFQPKVKKVTIDYYDTKQFVQGLFLDGIFIGEGNLKVQLYQHNPNKMIKEYDFIHNLNLFDKNTDLNFGIYTIKIFLAEEEDFFGFSKEAKLLYERKFIVGDPLIALTKNKIIKVLKCTAELESYYVDNFYLQNIRYSKTRGYYEADGFYYIKDWETNQLRKWYFSKYNPFVLKIACQSEFDFELEIQDKDRDGLIYDVQSKYVNPKYEEEKERLRLIDTITLESEEVF